jgi:hypothetical protein
VNFTEEFIDFYKGVVCYVVRWMAGSITLKEMEG